MTNEEAIKEINDLRCDIGSAYDDANLSPLWYALGMAIKALDQQPILDKIRAEINSPNRGTCDYFIVDRIEEIINKYKAES